MRARLRHFCCVLLFSVLSLPALAAKIPVGVMIYEGQTLDGSGVFHIFPRPSLRLHRSMIFFSSRFRGLALALVPVVQRVSCSLRRQGPRSSLMGRSLCWPRYRPAILIPLATDFWSRKSRLRFIWLPLRRAIELSRAEKLWPVCSDMPGYQRRKYMRVSVGRMMRTYNKAHPHAGG